MAAAGRAHLIAGGFPPGQSAGHDHDYARLRLLSCLADLDVPASVGNDFADVERWLEVSQLLITYVAGPYPNAEQCRALRGWLEAGGRWVGLHGTSGGRAERVEGIRNRRTVKTEHHELLGSFFLTHPPIRRFRVDVRDSASSLTGGLGTSFETVDEPYFIELQDPASTRILLTAEYGPDCVSPTIGPIYPADTSLLEDGRTRVIGYSREIGRGGVAYFTLGHNHNRTTNTQVAVDRNVDPSGEPPLVFRGSWETDAFQRLLRNAICWGLGD
jgi:type 1 glutamine amidotransferase